MRDVIILKAAQHVDDSIRLTDVSEEFVTQSFTFRSSFHQSGNVHNLACGGYDAPRMDNLCQLG